MTPPALTGREFEAALMDAAERYEKAGLLTMGRYGVQVAHQGNKMIALDSLPDFEGAVAPLGNQFIIEAKVSKESAFKLRPDKVKPRQIRHMIERSRFGVPCWVIIHWCERISPAKTIHEPAETVAIPVSDRLAFWKAFVDEAAAAKRDKRPFQSPGSINREHAARIGQRVEWTCPKGSRKHLPDLAALLGIRDLSLFKNDTADLPATVDSASRKDVIAG